jgi:hypothetical protein
VRCNIGFSVLYRYYERLPNGDYNREELKEMKRKVGDPIDDTTLEELASKVLAQMARRDIFVQDVEIFEYEKKKITFKETPGGIVLKNKKFSLDTIGHSLEAEIFPIQFQSSVIPAHLNPGSPVPTKQPQIQQEKVNGEGIPVPVELQGQVPIRVEVYDPEPDMLKAGLIKGKFTPGKRYPIFSEARDPREAKYGKELPILYITIDDMGRRMPAPSVAFRPPSGGLIGSFSNEKLASKDNLVWDNDTSQDVVDIR